MKSFCFHFILIAGLWAAPFKPHLSVQTKCPFKGTPINEKYFVDALGKRIYTCCIPCLDQVRSNPDQAISNLRTIYFEEPVDIDAPNSPSPTVSAVPAYEAKYVKKIAASILDKMDSDKNKLVSPDEFKAFHKGKSEQVIQDSFKRFDKNKDQQVDLLEIEAYYSDFLKP